MTIIDAANLNAASLKRVDRAGRTQLRSAYWRAIHTELYQAWVRAGRPRGCGQQQ